MPPSPPPLPDWSWSPDAVAREALEGLLARHLPSPLPAAEDAAGAIPSESPDGRAPSESPDGRAPSESPDGRAPSRPERGSGAAEAPAFDFGSALLLRAVPLRMDLEALPAPHLPPGTVRLLDHRPAADRLSFLLPSRGPSPREAARSCLLEWLHAEGARFFPPLLDALADETGIPRPSRVRIGRPRTRWASRSSSGTISCSVLLLFLPRDLLVHVLLHELAHVAHMNHGAAFHAHLARLDPLSSVHEKALRAAERNYVPAWVRD